MPMEIFTEKRCMADPLAAGAAAARCSSYPAKPTAAGGRKFCTGLAATSRLEDPLAAGAAAARCSSYPAKPTAAGGRKFCTGLAATSRLGGLGYPPLPPDNSKEQ